MKYFYLIPFFPFFSRLFIIIIPYKNKMNIILSEGELDKDTHRNYILALTGFSFSGLLAVSLLETTVIKGFNLTIYYLFISFLFFLLSSNCQSYKSKRWHDQLSTSFIEIGTLSLVLSVISVLFIKDFDYTFSLPILIIACLVWVFDHFYRLYLQSKYLHNYKRKNNNNGKE